jgi:hypothetical protein
MIFEVTDEQIELLNDADLRTLVGYLCEEEVSAHGYSPATVTRGGHQNAKDGGIDVRVNLPDDASISGYVRAAATGFQVKAQDMPRQEILDEMAPDSSLRESIAELASRRGAYIIVSSQGSLADSALQARKNAMLAAIDGAVPANSLIVDFYDRHRIATWVNQHPGLIPWVREKVARPLSGWRPFGDWSSSPAHIDKPYFLDGAVRLISPSLRDTNGLNATDGVNALRRLLETPKGVIRLVGLSGVGKTRLIQALFDDRIGANPLAPSQAVYTDISDSPDPVPLELVSHLISLQRRAILIVDNCGVELHRKLAARIAVANCLLGLITIEYDITDDEPENTDVFKLEAASIELIEKILEDRFPTLGAPSRSVIAKFSDGNARIALALAQTAKAGESLANLRDTELFRRLFEQSKGPSEELLDAAKVCALLYSFDGETLDGKDSELAPLAALARLSVDQLYKHVAELARRQLVQKRGKWRAILPHALAHHLAELALQDIPFGRIEAAIINSGSERMLRSFSKRMGYLHDNEHATALVAKWFGDKGLLEPIGNLNELGKALLTNVAPIDPAATLAFIESAAARHSWFFSSQNSNRTEIVRILRSIAYDPVLFDRSVALLRNFATSVDDEHDSAADVLKSLFFLYLSGTHAAPSQRATFIKGLLESENEAGTKLGLKLLGAMLECWHFSSHYPFEFGARSRDFGSNPRRRAEFVNWFSRAIQTAAEVGVSARAVAPEVRRLLASKLSELCRRVGMVDELAALAGAFTEHSGWPEGWIGIRSAIKRGKGQIEESQFAKLEALSEKLRPTSLADMVRTYAFSKEWEALDIAEAEEDEELKPLEARERIFELCVDLGQQLARNGVQLDSLLSEILTSDSQKTSALGKGIAGGCESLTECWRMLVEKFLALPERRRQQMVLGGFLDGAMTRNPTETETLLDGLLTDPRMHPFFLYCQVKAGINSRAFSRLMSALELETVPVLSYTNLAYGRVHEGFDDEEVRALSRRILEKDGGVAVVTEIIGMRIFGARSDKLPIGETLKGAGRDLLEQLHFKTQMPQSHHLLCDVVVASLDRPEHEDLARLLCTCVVDGIKNHRVYAWDVDDVIEALMKTFPTVALDIFVECDETDEYMSAWSIFRDVRGNRACPLQSLPDQVWMEWAEAKPQSRYVRLANVVKFSDASDDDKAVRWSSAAEKIISATPESSKVLDVFLDRFWPMSYSGSQADILATRMPMIEALLHHSRPEVAAWARENAPKFADSIARVREREAEQDRKRDERFE